MEININSSQKKKKTNNPIGSISFFFGSRRMLQTTSNGNNLSKIRLVEESWKSIISSIFVLLSDEKADLLFIILHVRWISRIKEMAPIQLGLYFLVPVIPCSGESNMVDFGWQERKHQLAIRISKYIAENR